MPDLKIVKMPIEKQSENRFMIIGDSGKVIDNAQGYGYKTINAAQKVIWYRFKGGKQKIQNIKSEALFFWKNNPEIKSFVTDFYEYNFKELYRGEVTEDDLIDSVKEKFNVTLNKKYIEYM